MANSLKYYDIKRTIKTYPDALYYVVFGERSNGKSFSTLSYAVEEFYNSIPSGYFHSLGYIRRWSEDITASNMEEVFKSLKSNDNGDNQIEKLTKGTYNDVKYRSRKFYLIHVNEEGEIDNECVEPFAYVFSLAESERKKSTGYPTIKTILLEEFISEGLPMVNEFSRFKSVLSTIIRNRNDVKIILLGNTIKKHNIYFNEFGLTRVKTQVKNTVDIYKYVDGDSVLKLACEFSDFPDRKKIKQSNVYFAFENRSNSMIKEGSWDIGEYPHLTHFYKPNDVKMMYFISFDNEIFQCEVIRVKDTKENVIINDSNRIYSNKNVTFTYIHRKTSEIKFPYKQLIFQQDYDPHDNIRRKITNSYDDVGKFILSFFTTEQVMYQDNMVGDSINSYFEWCKYSK